MSLLVQRLICDGTDNEIHCRTWQSALEARLRFVSQFAPERLLEFTEPASRWKSRDWESFKQFISSALVNIFRVALTVALKLRGSEGPAGASGVNSVEEKNIYQPSLRLNISHDPCLDTFHGLCRDARPACGGIWRVRNVKAVKSTSFYFFYNITKLWLDSTHRHQVLPFERPRIYFLLNVVFMSGTSLSPIKNVWLSFVSSFLVSSTLSASCAATSHPVQCTMY